MDRIDRYLGCMLGGATGDALGFIIEFDSWATIKKKYGPYGLRTVLKLDANNRQCSALIYPELLESPAD